MAATKKKYTGPILVALVALLLPLFVSLKNTEKPNLTGLVISDEKPEWSWSAWFNGDYQKLRDDYNNDHWGWKEIMVRANNQLYYQAFNQIRVNKFVIGKDDYIFSENYIHAAFGDDLVDEAKVAELMRKAKVVQDTLKKKGIDLFCVFAPGKASYCMDKIEDKYVHPIKRTNYDNFISHSLKNKVNTLDLKRYFDLMKPTTPYPLFPVFGHHWSFYGECLAVDTIIGFIERLHGCDLPAFQWATVEVSDTARSRDADVLKSMNLLHNPKQRVQLAYPDVEIENDTNKNNTKVLTIADSYWYGPVYMGVGNYCFAGGAFWYYYNKVIPSPRQGEKVEVWELDLKSEIESNEVIMVLYSDGNLPGFGNTFIQDAYELYVHPEQYKTNQARRVAIQSYAKQIREAPLLLKKATRFSETQNISLDSAIIYEANKMAGYIKSEK